MPNEKQRKIRESLVDLRVGSIKVSRNSLPVTVDLAEVVGSSPTIYRAYVWYDSTCILGIDFSERDYDEGYKTLIDKLKKGAYDLELTPSGLRMNLR